MKKRGGSLTDKTHRFKMTRRLGQVFSIQFNSVEDFPAIADALRQQGAGSVIFDYDAFTIEVDTQQEGGQFSTTTIKKGDWLVQINGIGNVREWEIWSNDDYKKRYELYPEDR